MYIPEIKREYEEAFHQHIPVCLDGSLNLRLFWTICSFRHTPWYSHTSLHSSVVSTKETISVSAEQQLAFCAWLVSSLCYASLQFACTGSRGWLLSLWSSFSRTSSWWSASSNTSRSWSSTAGASLHILLPCVKGHLTRTVGWTIYNVLLDFSGGLLSILQFFINCAVLRREREEGSDADEWSGLKSNLVKLGLGSVSMFFDILFMIQHFILYPDHEDLAEPLSLLDSIEKQDIPRTASGRVDMNAMKTPSSVCAKHCK